MEKKIIGLVPHFRLRALTMNNYAKQIIVFITTVLLALTLFIVNQSLAKGPMDSEASYFIKHTISQIFIREKLCISAQDCIEHNYLLYTAWNSISYDMYGITDEKIIKEIFLAILNSDLKISHFRVWDKSKSNKSFFDKPILEFTNHI